MEKQRILLIEFEEMCREQMEPLTAESLRRQIDFIDGPLDRICYYAYKDEKNGYLIGNIKFFIRRTLRNIVRFTADRGRKEISDVINKSRLNMSNSEKVVSVFDAIGCEDSKTNLVQRTYCVFQSCDNHGLNRLVDKISSSVQMGIDYYSSMGEVLFIPNHNEKEVMPKNLQFFDKEKLTVSDIEWLRNNQDYYGMPIADWIQKEADNGNFGITRGIYVRVFEDHVSAHPFIVELRRIY